MAGPLAGQKSGTSPDNAKTALTVKLSERSNKTDIDRQLRRPFSMSNVTQILSALEQGDPSAAERLLPLVYEELRSLAARRLAQEKSGQTLEATALVHEAYLRLVDVEQAQN